MDNQDKLKLIENDPKYQLHKSQFHANPLVNPVTKRKIKPGLKKYNELVALYDYPNKIILTENNLPTSNIPSSSAKSNITQTMNTKNISEFESVIGGGKYGIVEKHILNGEEIVVKRFIVDDDNVGYGIGIETLNEIHCLQLMKSSPYILQLLGVNIDVIGLITEVSIMVKYYTSDLNRFAFYTTLNERIRLLPTVIIHTLKGLYHMHIRGLIHGDIKPNNILVEYRPNKIFSCVIADFGLSQQFSCNPMQRKNNKITHMVYTANFRPPEILRNERYTDKTDIWAMGMSYISYLKNENIIKNTENSVELLSSIFDYLTEDENGDEFIDVYSLFMESVIDDRELNVMKKMLYIDVHKRTSITELIGPISNFFSMNIMPPRGEILNGGEHENLLYNQCLYFMIDICRNFYNIKVYIGAVDLFERYIAKYGLIKNIMIILSCVCIAVTAKICWLNGNLTILQNIANTYIYKHDILKTEDLKIKNLSDLLEFENMFVKRMNYLFISCEIDEYVKKFSTLSDPFGYLIQKTQDITEAKYHGVLSYKEIIKLMFPIS